MSIKQFSISIIIILFVFKGFSQNLSPQKQTQVDQYKEMITKYKAEGNKSEAANYLNKIAYIYWENGISKSAIDYFNQSLEIYLGIGNKDASKSIYLNLGKIYSDMNQLENALTNYQKGLKISRTHKKSTEIASCLISIANIQTSLKKYNDAITSLEEAMNVSKEINNEKNLRNCYLKLSENYKNAGNKQKSDEYMVLYSSFDKNVQNIELKKIQEQKDNQLNQLYNKTTQIEEEKKLTESQLKTTVSSLKEFETLSIEQKKQIYMLNIEKQLNEMKKKEIEDKLRQTRMFIFSIIAFAILVILVAIISFRAYKQKKKTNIVLESQNKEILLQKDKIENQNLKITDSITYAQRIQQSFLSSEESLQKHIPESFIVFKPRDIVSGDFYWFIETGKKSPFKKFHNNETIEDDKLIISAVDCTGHGVPGAIMSMIGYNQLNAIAFRGVIETNEMLNELHKGIRSALRQYKNDNRDGMDMAICAYNKEQNILDFSGAKNPLIYIKNNEVNIIKGDRFPIGGIQKEPERLFTKHTLKIDQPTDFYIFSDGFIDQFGGEQGEKYGIKRFADLLLKINSESIEKKKSILEETFIEWQGNNYTQTDDQLLMGFKINPA